jgi:hypothetical protein
METPPSLHPGYSEPFFASSFPAPESTIQSQKDSVAGSASSSAENSPKFSTALDYLIAGWLKTLPFLFWGSIWMLIFGISTVSISSLLNLNSSDQNLIRFDTARSQKTESQKTESQNLESQSGTQPGMGAIAAPVATPSTPPSDSLSANSQTFTSNPQRAPKPESQGGRISPWLFGGVVLSCIIGSMALSSQLRSQSQSSAAGQDEWEPEETEADLLTASNRPITRRRGKQQPKRLALYSPSEPLPFVPAVPTSEQPLSRSAPSSLPTAASALPLSASPLSASNPLASTPQRTTAKIPVFRVAPLIRQRTRQGLSQPPSQLQLPAISEPPGMAGVPGLAPETVPVLVVPNHQSHSLDWQEGRLADAVDLRRQRSLDSLI